jgi:hypothetical protein
MNRQAALVEEVKQDSVEKIDASALRNSARNIPQPTASANAAPKPNFSDRIKGLLANIAKALEGDHETQHYRS